MLPIRTHNKSRSQRVESLNYDPQEGQMQPFSSRMTSVPYHGGPSREMKSLYKSNSDFSSLKRQNTDYDKLGHLSRTFSTRKHDWKRSEQNWHCSDVPIERNKSHKYMAHLNSSGHYSRRSPNRIENFGECPSALSERISSVICIKYLPESYSSNSMKNELLRMYTQYGTINCIQICSTGSERYALIEFAKYVDADKALAETDGQRFLNVQIQVSPHESLELDETDLRTACDVELDEFHPKATRILFIGGLDKEITISELRTHFEQFGEIIEITIKNQNSSTFAFCQYSDILSVIYAIKKFNGKFLRYNKLTLEFGLSVPSCCIWIGGISHSVMEDALCEYFGRYGVINNLSINRENGCALIAFETERQASLAVTEMRSCLLNGKRLRIDFASEELQESFLEKLNKHEYISHIGNNRSYSERGELEELVENSFKSNLHEGDVGQRFENRLCPPASLLPTNTTGSLNCQGYHLGGETETWLPQSNQSFESESESITPALRAFETSSRQHASNNHSANNHESFSSECNASNGRFQCGKESLLQKVPSISNRAGIKDGVRRRSQMARDKRTLFRKRLKLSRSLSKCTTVLQKLKVEKNIEEINKKLKQMLELATSIKGANVKNETIDEK